MTEADREDTDHALLLADLSRLLHKHGRKSFESLARDLADPQFTASLVAVLSATARASPLPPDKPRKKRQDPLERVRIDLEKRDDDDAIVLIRTVDNVLSNSARPSLRDIRMLAERLELTMPKSLKSRRDALARVVRQILDSPPEARSEITQELAAISEGDSGSLEEWSRIIERSRRDSSS